MDGTGQLFSPLINTLPNNIEYILISLNKLQASTYLAQAKEISNLVGDDRLIIIAESYSGNIAYMLSKILNDQILKIIFIASFLSAPIRLIKITSVIPTWFMDHKFIPDCILNYFCFSGYGNAEHVKMVRNSIEQVAPKTLKQRLKNMNNIESTKQQLNTEVIYIQPTQDRLVSSRAFKKLVNMCTNIKIHNVAGGHFIAQTNPSGCVNVILMETACHLTNAVKPH